MVVGLDTHRAVRELRDAGFDEPQAKAIVTVAVDACGAAVVTGADTERPVQRLSAALEGFERRVMTTFLVASTVATGLVLAAIGVSTMIILRAV